MNLEDIKDRVRETATNLWSQIQEDPTFNTLREKYESLPTNTQKGIIAGVVVVVLSVLFFIPYSYLSSSSSFVEEYEDHQQTIRELLKVSRLNQGGVRPPEGLSSMEMQTRLRGIIETSGLLPEQIGDMQEFSGGLRSYARPPIITQGVQVALNKLNLQQIVEIGYNLQQAHPTLKMAGLEIKADATAPGYFNVIYKIVSFSMPMEQEKEEKPAQKGSARRRGSQ